MTFRPRMMVNTTKLDLTTQLFGESLFVPILIGPTSQQQRYHPEGELAMARGASAAKTAMVVADRSSFPIEQIAAQAKTTLWYQIYPEADTNAMRSRVEQAIKSGCKAVCLTLGGADSPPEGADWSAIDRLRKGITVPFLLKGIMSPDEAQTAVERGIQGIVVSNYGTHPVIDPVAAVAQPIEMLPAIADAVAGKIPILIDGSFPRGSDVLKGLALGAQAILLARPFLWSLAAYGAEGVRAVLELLQSELARNMAECGKVNLKAIDRGLVSIRRR